MLLLDNSASSPCTQSFTLTFFEDPYSRRIPGPVAEFSWHEEQFTVKYKVKKSKNFFYVCATATEDLTRLDHFPILMTGSSFTKGYEEMSSILADQ